MRYLGVDFGLRRIGLATSEYGQLTSPFKVLEVTGFKDAKSKLSQVITEGGFDKIIIGLPEGKIGNTVIGFIKTLKKMGFDVESADESLSTKQAVTAMIELEIPKSKRRSSDATAAAIILQNYLDNKENLD